MTNASSASKRLDQALAIPMFLVSLTFLLFLAGVLHLHESEKYRGVVTFCHWGMIVLHPLFVAELVAHYLMGSCRWRRDLLFCLLPPLRLGARDHGSGNSIWLPRIGWATVNLDLRERLERGFSIPMIAVAVMVLPLLGVEYVWKQQIANNETFALATFIAEGLVWLAFTIEFLVMISVVDRKLLYCKQHWIDLAVILLPLVAFLRAARITRALRLHQQLTKTAKVFRLRGTAMRAYRSILVLDVIDRLFRSNPETRLRRLEKTLEEKQHEMDELQAEISELRVQVAPVVEQRKKAA